MFYPAQGNLRLLSPHFPMASKSAHESTGWAAGVIAAALVGTSLKGDATPVWCLLAFLMAYSGGTAPDWMEISWWKRGSGRHSWITHRTWTHWGLPWLAALWFSYVFMPQAPPLSLLFGFAAGGVMHLLADFPNPLGVPWLLPTRRHSLRWWNSGRYDLIVVSAAWLTAAYLSDQAWFDGQMKATLLDLFAETLWPWLAQQIGSLI